MAIIMIDLGNGTSIAKLDTDGCAECDYICENCIAYGRCHHILEQERYERVMKSDEAVDFGNYYDPDERETTSPDNAVVVDNAVFVDDEFVGIRCNNHDCPRFDLVEFDNSYGQPCGFQGCEHHECDHGAGIEESIAKFHSDIENEGAAQGGNMMISPEDCPF